MHYYYKHSDHGDENPRNDYSSVAKIVTTPGAGYGDYTADDPDAEVPENAFFVTKVWLYRHSGDVLKFGDLNPFSGPWDSGQCGIAWMPRENLDEWDGDLTLAQRAFRFELEAYAAYVAGEVYDVYDPQEFVNYLTGGNDLMPERYYGADSLVRDFESLTLIKPGHELLRGHAQVIFKNAL